MTQDNHFLGKFDLTEIPPAPRGVPILSKLYQNSDSDSIYKSSRDFEL